MKAVVQRVLEASVHVDSVNIGSIDSGLLVYLGVAQDDSQKDADWLAQKIPYLRIFNDDEGKMNLSLLDVTPGKRNGKAGILAISQFTLLGDAVKGRRPSWSKAAEPEKAKELYLYFIEKIRLQNIFCECGKFQASMKVKYTNDGPVTIILDSREKGIGNPRHTIAK